MLLPKAIGIVIIVVPNMSLNNNDTRVLFHL